MRPAAFDTTSITVVADEIRAEPTKSYYEYTLEWENSNYESSSIVIFQVGNFIIKRISCLFGKFKKSFLST